MHRVNVSDRINFGAEANTKDNIYGNPSYNKVVFYDDFLGSEIDVKNFTQSDDNGGTVAISVESGGAVTLTTGATDDDRAIITGSLNWKATKNCVMEARVKVDRITLCSFGVGFTDATTEGDNVQPFSVSGSTVTDTCSDGAAIVFDTDATTDYYWVVNTKANTQGGNILPSTCVPVADTYQVFRVELDTSGNAKYFIDGVQVGYKASAVTAATALTPYVSNVNRAGAALVTTVDYIKCWQDR